MCFTVQQWGLSLYYDAMEIQEVWALFPLVGSGLPFFAVTSYSREHDHTQSSWLSGVLSTAVNSRKS